MKIKRKVLIFIIGLITFPVIAYILLPDWLPTQEQIRGCITTQMYKVNLCPGSKEYVPLNKIASVLQKTIVLTEDSGFYDHHGFDWKSIEANARKGWATGSFKRGGSSISQQLAKNLFLTQERSFWRKAKEAVITDRIENTLSKDEILERYLNVIEFGKNVYGIKAAALYYFKKTPAQLDTVESSFLAMLLPNPIKYSQSYYKKELTPFAQNRMNKIIQDMYQYNRINEEQYSVAQEKLAWFFKAGSPPIGEELFLTDEQLRASDTDFENFMEPTGVDVEDSIPSSETFPTESIKPEASQDSNFEEPSEDSEALEPEPTPAPEDSSQTEGSEF